MLFVILKILTALGFSITSNTYAAYIDVAVSPASNLVPFYKSKESKFPSGYSTIENLKKKQLGHSLAPEKYYLANGKLFHTQDLYPIFATHLANSVVDPKTNKRLYVKSTNVNFLFVTSAGEGKTLFKYTLGDLTSDAYDAGVIMTLKDLYLKKTSTDQSAILTTIPQGERLTALIYKDGYAQVQYKAYKGYINLSEVISKYDFATYAFSENKWNVIKSRSFDFLVTNDNKKIHLSKISGIIVNDRLGIIGSNSQKIPIWSRVVLVDKSQAEWAESKLKDHGFVWWKPTNKIVETFYSIDDLLRKEIASVSFNPKNPLQGVLSSHGVYLTENGTDWKKIERFDDYHGPVHYFNQSLIFVGNFRSIDGGKTFENYIQLDRLANTIENQYGFYPKKLQVKKIETFEPYKMKIEVDTGTRRLKLESPLFAQDWRPSKG